MQDKEFKPTKEMLQATETLLKSIALVRTIAPIVERYQKKNLDVIQPKNKEGELITDLKYTYRMNDKDFAVWMSLCNTDREVAGLYVDDPEKCPLLVAQNLQRQAEDLLIKAMEPITGLTTDQLSSKLEYRKKMINLSLKLLTRFIDTKKVKAEILRGTIT